MRTRHMVEVPIHLFVAGEEEYADGILDVEVCWDSTDRSYEVLGYSVFGRSVMLRSIEKHNPRVSWLIEHRVYEYISNLQ